MRAAPPREHARRRRRLLLIGLAVVLTAGGAAVLGQAAALRLVTVTSDAMRPTLEPGDRVLVETASLPGRALERGELVAVADDAAIQRVIGLPGEIVEIRAGVVHVDGAPLSEPYAVLGERDAAPIHLPPDRYWVVGDHRPASREGGGPGRAVARDELLGRVMVVLWPPTRVSRELDAEPEPAARAGRQLPR